MRSIALAALLLSHTAFAFVRSTSPRTGVPFTWQTSCIPIFVDARGSQDSSLAVLQGTLARSCDNWSTRTNVCSQMRLIPMGAEKDEEVGNDARPVLVVRDVEWRRPGGMPHDPSAIGLTTVFHVSTPGRYGDATILDTDIELNGVNFTLTTTPATTQPRPGTGLADLENTITHELGHVLGLAHTCWDRTTLEPPLDDKGQRIPDCLDTLPPAILETTMYPYSMTPGETDKRSLSDDDVRGVCDVYPSSAPAKACFQRVQGGCRMPGGSSGWAVLWVLLVAWACKRSRA